MRLVSILVLILVSIVSAHEGHTGHVTPACLDLDHYILPLFLVIGCIVSVVKLSTRKN